MERSTLEHQILIADDDASITDVLSEVLQEEGYAVSAVHSGPDVLERLKGAHPYRLVLLDVQMPGMDGLDVLGQIHQKQPDLPIIMITAFGTSTVAIRAMQMGANDYLQKPFNLDEVLLVVKKAFEYQELASRVRSLEERADIRERMIGQTAVMREVYKTIGRVASASAGVLITGETGTGKELVANLVHQNSGRKGEFIPVNCAALPESLIESELFGHEKGAYTGAMTMRKGRFELANRGTIFLDEVGEITLGVQKKLLRVLQEGIIERVGGATAIQVDARVLAATNRDLLHEVEEGRFREDLYYRLNVINVHMPPLRERKEDIPLLAEHFLNKYRYRNDASPTRISEEAMERLVNYNWPGNVRQLENEIERAVVLSQGAVITSRFLSLSANNISPQIDLSARVRNGSGLENVLASVEQTMINEALRQSASVVWKI
ncbi:MAG: sigma-54-dependent Fis family transcriptional regulator [Chloroflexales bacterium]|nr:sigma-54-dependent Fis family transcriptional regulator [Chloroflexales bacterium]